MRQFRVGSTSLILTKAAAMHAIAVPTVNRYVHISRRHFVDIDLGNGFLCV